MAIPMLNEHHLLPAGVHDCTLEEVRALFGQFRRSDCRPRLFSALQRYVDELQASKSAVQLVIDGSFVMQLVDEPGDIDLILVMPKDWDMACDVRPFEYNLLSKKRVRKNYGFDLFVAQSGSEPERQMIEFFQEIKEERCKQLGIPISLKKGLLRISL